MLDWLSVISCYALQLVLFCRLWGLPWWQVVILNIAAYVLTDFAAGHLHWFLDTYFAPTTPILGRFIEPFREHHTNPLIITQHSFVEANGSSSLAVLPLLVGAILLSPYHPLIATLLGGIASLSTLTNTAHKWAHQEHTGVIRKLQTIGIILSPEMHEKHHTQPHNSNYTITSGACNHLLGPGYWRFIESKLPWKVQREA